MKEEIKAEQAEEQEIRQQPPYLHTPEHTHTIHNSV